MTGAAEPRPASAPIPPPERRGELAASLSVAVPLVLTNLGAVAMNTTDVVMLGWLGAEALAAGVLGFTLIFLVLLIGFGIPSAVTPLAAQALGAGDPAAMRRTIRQGFWATAIYCVPAVAVLLNGETILLFLGQDPQAAALAGVYLLYASWSLPFVLAITVLRAFLAAIDRVAIVFWISCFGIVLNALLNYGLIFGHWGFPRLEIAGSAIATTLTNAIGFAVLAAYVTMHPATRGYRVFSRLLRPDLDRLKEIVRVGLPVSFTYLFEEGLFAAATIMVGWLGPIMLAGHTVAVQCASVAYMVPAGIAQAATVRVGIAAGRSDPSAIGRAGWTAMALGVGFMALVAISFWLAPGPLARLFLDPADPNASAVLAIAVSLLGIAALFQLFDGAQVVGLGVLRGLNDTRVPLGFAVFGYWVLGAPLAYVLGFVAGYGAVGVWIGFIAGLGTVALLTLIRFSRRDRLGLLDRFVPAEA